jgi:hypothetical protein
MLLIFCQSADPGASCLNTKSLKGNRECRRLGCVAASGSGTWLFTLRGSSQGLCDGRSIVCAGHQVLRPKIPRLIRFYQTWAAKRGERHRRGPECALSRDAAWSVRYAQLGLISDATPTERSLTRRSIPRGWCWQIRLNEGAFLKGRRKYVLKGDELQLSMGQPGSDC